ncbi:MAG: hypothetical protein KQJ78_07600 [Deltaproteobacteria bacterium]|nr:hypothetical protein [Deltaproteobacteria bacterium]
MSIIYEPRGPALEYAPLAANLYKGCSHGCRYCYAPDATRTDRKTFHADIRPRPNVLQQLEKDAARFAGDPRSILLSFTSDPYQPAERELRLTRQALDILLNPMLGLRVDVLTKAGTLAERDFDLLAQAVGRASIASTLTFADPGDSFDWEPLAALPRHRLALLEKANHHGIPTWASLEPVIKPDQTLELIELGHGFVDQFKIGKMNHFKDIEAGIDWVDFRGQAEELLRGYGFKRRLHPHGGQLKGTYYLKADLVRATDHAFSKTAA